jgi:hypothetical protein
MGGETPIIYVDVYITRESGSTSVVSLKIKQVKLNPEVRKDLDFLRGGVANAFTKAMLRPKRICVYSHLIDNEDEPQTLLQRQARNRPHLISQPPIGK